MLARVSKGLVMVDRVGVFGLSCAEVLSLEVIS